MGRDLHELASAEAEPVEGSLQAASVAVRVLVSHTAEINGIPVHQLIAAQLGISNPDRIAAQREVQRLLESAQAPLQVAVEQKRLQTIKAQEMQTQPSETGDQLATQIH
ncbi:MAG TPA: hypothetical protein VFW90_00620 [Candidatus Saccharimonadales bacterium]|nr:hypothetical protein [Candidatus Saccharimonadales bacterium]